MFGLFKKKRDLTELYTALQNLQNKASPGLDVNRVTAPIIRYWKTQPKELIQSLESGMQPMRIAASAVANVSGDLLETGQFSVYRGVLGIEGEALLRLNKVALDALVTVGAISEEEAYENHNNLCLCLKSVG